MYTGSLKLNKKQGVILQQLQNHTLFFSFYHNMDDDITSNTPMLSAVDDEMLMPSYIVPA